MAPRGAGTPACRAETRLDTFRGRDTVSNQERPHEWGRGRQECLRHGIRPFGSAERQFCMQPRRLVLSVVLLAFPAVPSVLAQSTSITVVNAASYDRTIAPDSLAT